MHCDVRKAGLSVAAILLVFAGGQSCAESPSEKIPDRLEFNRDVRRILSDNCYYCHGPDKNKREADLRLDTEEGLKGADGEGGAITPGDPAASELIHRVITSDADIKMPPPETGKELSQRDIETLDRWVREGGHFEGHWSFLPIKDVAPGSSSPSVVIDELIEAGLKQNKLLHSPEADRITLLRRLSFDLVGLPPTQAEVAMFINDASEDAYEVQVDRLMSSPHFGERMAMWWLDLVRYADTVGYHGDQPMSVAPYREYVIDSFNANKPFDQFTIEQLAGDLLPDPTREQRVASGYNRLGMMSAEGGVQDKEYLAKYISERVRNASGTWLGITLGCAECHDHKFDPLTTVDFYRFEAFFADIKERGLYSGANQSGNWGSFIKVPSDQQAAELSELDAQIADVKRILNTETPELAAAQATWEQSRTPWTTITPATLSSLAGATLSTREDGTILASGTNGATDTYTLSFTQLPPGVTAVRIEALPDATLPKSGPGRAGNGNFVLTELSLNLKVDDSSTAVPLQNATATYEQTGAANGNPYGKWSAQAAIDGDSKGAKWGWAVMEKVGARNYAVFETVTDLTLTSGTTLDVVMAQNLDNPGHNLGCFKISVTSAPRPLVATDDAPPELTVLLDIESSQRTEPQKKKLAEYYRTIAPQLSAARDQLAALEKQRTKLDETIPTTLVTESVSPRMIRVLPRGNWMDDSGEVVTPAFPAALTSREAASGAGEQAEGRTLNRLDLAKWIVAPENPLTSRVVVNRLWKIFFGAGISKRLDDLGSQGEWPSHPKLLDFLANDLKTHNWDLKRTIKSVVMSNAYRQTSLADANLRAIDPYNQWIARQGRFRLDAELVRDNALAISGLLVTSIGGPSVKPYQPPGYWSYLNFPTREWQNGEGESLYRRGLYTHWQRQYLHPSLLAFDAPNREECTADRPRSNTPLQSLVLLNDPSYVEAARAFAELIMQHDKDTSSRIDFAFRQALSRPAKTEETEVLQQLLESHQAEYKADMSAASELLAVGAKPLPADISIEELAAWTSLARVILNLHETITRN
jgi:hypothetical protein